LGNKVRKSQSTSRSLEAQSDKSEKKTKEQQQIFSLNLKLKKATLLIGFVQKEIPTARSSFP